MGWFNLLQVNQVIAIVGVMTGFIGAAAAIVTARWNRRAVATEEAFAALKQQMELLKQQAAQTEANLKEQLAHHKDLSPSEIHKQLGALKTLLTERTQWLEQQLDASNALLREKSAEVSEQKMAAATMMGWGKIWLGINDAELLARSLHSLISMHGRVIDFGEVDLSVKSFYVGIMRLLIRNENFVGQFTSNSPEYVIDHIIMPLLACVKYKILVGSVSDSLEIVFDAMGATPYAHETPIYREALEQAKSGYDFGKESLPPNLSVKLMKAAQQSKKSFDFDSATRDESPTDGGGSSV